MLTRRDFIKKSGFLAGALFLFPNLVLGNTKELTYPLGAPQNPVNSLKEAEKVINDTYLNGLKPQDNYNITPGYVNLGAKVSPLKFKVL